MEEGERLEEDAVWIGRRMEAKKGFRIRPAKNISG
jgi:hypothetical protein